MGYDEKELPAKNATQARSYRPLTDTARESFFHILPEKNHRQDAVRSLTEKRIPGYA